MAVVSVPSKWDYHSPRVWVLLAAVITFVPAFFISTVGFQGVTLQIAAGVAAGSVGALVWWVLVERPSKPTLLRGTVFGFLTVLLSKPLTWLIHGIILIVLGDTYHVEGGGLSGLLLHVADGTSISLLIVGIITFPLGIILGIILVVLRRRIPPESESQ